MTKHFVYIVESENGLIKIGFSCSPEGRFQTIMCNSPVKVRIVAIWEGVREDEAILHRRFAKQHHRREWFHCNGEVAAFVEEVRGRGVIANIDWDCANFGKRTLKRPEQSQAMRRYWSDRQRKSSRPVLST